MLSAAEQARLNSMSHRQRVTYEDTVVASRLASEDFPILPVSKTDPLPRLPDEPDDNLTPPQRLAIAALVCGRTYSAAAQEAGVTQRTLYTWRQQPNFRHQVDRLSREMLETVTTRVRNVMLRASRHLASVVGTDGLQAFRALNSKRLWEVMGSGLDPAPVAVEPNESAPPQNGNIQIVSKTERFPLDDIPGPCQAGGKEVQKCGLSPVGASRVSSGGRSMSENQESRQLYGKAVGVGLVGLAGLAGLFTPTESAKADKPLLTSYDLKSLKKVYESPPAPAAFKFGVNLATGDFNGDGSVDIAAVNSHGPSDDAIQFMKFRPETLSLAYEKHSPWLGTRATGGVRVAAGDVNGDGKADLIFGEGEGGGSGIHVSEGYVFKQGFPIKWTTSSFDAPMSGGVHVAAGDLDGDGRADILVGNTADPRSSSQPFGRVRRISVDQHPADATDLAEYIKFREEYAPFGQGYQGGVRVAVGDVNGDGRADLVSATEGSSSSISLNFAKLRPASGVASSLESFSNLEIATFGSPSGEGGFAIAVGDLDGDGRAEVVIGSSPGGGGPHVKVFTYDPPAPDAGGFPGANEGWSLFGEFDVLNTPEYQGGLSLAIVDIDGDGVGNLIVGPQLSMLPEPATLSGLGAASMFVLRRRRRPTATS